MDLTRLWRQRGEWEIRVLVLSSLSLQIFLLFAGGLRKRKSNWWLRVPLWLAYLLADYIAIYSLGHLSQNQKLCNGSLDEEMHLLVFWPRSSFSILVARTPLLPSPLRTMSCGCDTF